MTTGSSGALLHRLTAATLAAAAIAPAGRPGAAAQPKPELVQLMQELSRVKVARGKFVERKHLAILETPLESSGTLLYTAPARLEKHTLAPRRESLVLDGDTLAIESGGRRRSFALHEHPVVWAFAEGIRSTLAGDLQTLQRFYEVSLEGDTARWRLRLKPLEQRTRALAAEIAAGGSGPWVYQVEILEGGGARSVWSITREAA